MRKLLPLAVSLLCCVVFYVVIWKRFQAPWTSPKKVYYELRSDGHKTAEHVTAAITTITKLSSRKTTRSPEKEKDLNSVHNVTPHREAPLGKPQHTTNADTVPVLFKKDFRRAPKWDFEDLYMLSTEERRPVCSKSLQKTTDKEFQAAFIPNIQLWLHNGHLNLSEWKRLSHFNNPFGFMEYKYSDIKPPVDLIPKPRSAQLLPVPEGAEDGCIRCAVVGTGGILSGSGMGNEINSHHYVFRVNGAVIKGYEEDVGTKTSVYVHTSYALFRSFLLLKPYGFTSIPSDKGIKYILIPEGQRDLEWIQGLLQKDTVKKGTFKGILPLNFYGGRFDKDRMHVLHPDFLRYIRNRFLKSQNMKGDYWHLYRPTNGAFTLFLALHTCDIVNVYGFITEDHAKYSNYYFERTKKTSVVFYLNHDYNLEIQTWKKLHDAGIINLYQRKENLNMQKSDNSSFT